MKGSLPDDFTMVRNKALHHPPQGDEAWLQPDFLPVEVVGKTTFH